MKIPLCALAAIVTVLTVSCGSTATPVGAPLTVTQLKYRVIDEVGPPAFCDPDFYPVARIGGEQANADAMYDQIRSDSELYSAIVAHAHLPPGVLDEAQKLILYRAFKLLRALALTRSQDGYAFAYTVDRSYMKVSGAVRTDGVVSVASRTQGSRPECPICLAAGTLIATPAGDLAVTAIVPGTLVWTLDRAGRRIAEPVVKMGSIAVPPGHLMVHLVLADGRDLLASPGHPTADGRMLGSLSAGDRLDGSLITTWELIPYAGARTYDLLPAGPTGFYWADGILLASTLAPAT
jgi:hypothetical protein